MNDKQTLFETLRNMGVVLNPRNLDEMFDPTFDPRPEGVVSALGFGGHTFLFNVDGKLIYTNDGDGVDNFTDAVADHISTLSPQPDNWSEELDKQIADACELDRNRA